MWICMVGNLISTKEKPCACTDREHTDSTLTGSNCGCVEGKPESVSEDKGKLRVVLAPKIYRERRPVKGEVVTVIDVTFGSSGIDLVDAWSRAVPRGEIHEIMVWNPLEEEGGDMAAIAFIEITQGGNIVNGDGVRVDGEPIGSLAGFDYNHMPNHMNIVVETKGLDVPLRLGSVVEFTPNSNSPKLDEDCC